MRPNAEETVTPEKRESIKEMADKRGLTPISRGITKWTDDALLDGGETVTPKNEDEDVVEIDENGIVHDPKNLLKRPEPSSPSTGAQELQWEQRRITCPDCFVTWTETFPAERPQPQPSAELKERAMSNIDWQQVVLNGGPPCFHIENDKFCLRAERWPGHDRTHKFVTLAAFSSSIQEEAHPLQNDPNRGQVETLLKHYGWEERFGKWGCDAVEQICEALQEAEKGQEEARQQIEGLKKELVHEKARVCVGGDVFEANRNQHILHLSTELAYLERAESAEQQLAEARAQGMKEAAEIARKYEGGYWGSDGPHGYWHCKDRIAANIEKQAEPRAGRDLEGK